jgi:hypothetical protein
VPGDVLLHPVALGALGLLVLNDHLGKRVAPGLITGKASDVAGLVLFPLLVLAVVEVLRRRVDLGPVVIASIVGVTACAFIAVKMEPGIARWYSQALGYLMAPVRVALRQVRGDGTRPVRVLSDAADLVALPALGVALAIGLRRSRLASRHGGLHSADADRPAEVRSAPGALP